MVIKLIVMLFLLSSTPIFGQSTTVTRGGSLEIDLLGGSTWGPLNRDADHATIAMNSVGDIVVAYHSSRNDISSGLKQAEVVYFQFVPGASPAQDSWVLLERILIGSVDHSVIPLLTQQNVKCERPDVIAVEDKFFVTWTRRYNRNYDFPNQREEPSVLECAWLERNGSAVSIIGSSGGLGYPLDLNYFTRECTGVADAVVLEQPMGGLPTVGVVYPRQVDFGDFTGDNTRLFELTLVTCSLNGFSIDSSSPTVLRDNIPIDGPSGPGGTTAGGLVLPDLAPSGEDNAFWVAYEGQQVVAPNVHGRIRLEYWKKNPGTNLWQQEVGKVFNTVNPMTTVARRRPMVSALPGTGTGEEVSIAFNLATGSAGSSDLDIDYSQWVYVNGGIQALLPPDLAPVS